MRAMITLVTILSTGTFTNLCSKLSRVSYVRRNTSMGIGNRMFRDIASNVVLQSSTFIYQVSPIGKYYLLGYRAEDATMRSYYDRPTSAKPNSFISIEKFFLGSISIELTPNFTLSALTEDSLAFPLKFYIGKFK